MSFSAAPSPVENFCVGVSKIYGPRDLLSLDTFYCIWCMWVFVIPIEEEGTSLFNGPSGSGRVLVSTFFSSVSA